jgi:thiopeptide-type bacteriocin biosynthesis protein
MGPDVPAGVVIAAHGSRLADDPARAARQGSRTAGTHYEAAPFFMVRAPLLPVEYASSLPGKTSPADLHSLVLGESAIRTALAVGGGQILDALSGQSWPRREADGERLVRKVRRFLIRMATRSTPYGLFAGVGMGSWAPRTDLAIDHVPRPVTARIAMDWLQGFLMPLQADPRIRRWAILRANTTVLRRGDRFVLPEPLPGGRHDRGTEVSIRATRPVQHVLRAARHPLLYRDLVESVLEVVDGATPEMAERLIDDMCELTFLVVTDLRPALTGTSAIDRTADLLGGSPDTADAAKALRHLELAGIAWSRGGGMSDADGYLGIEAQARRAGPGLAGPAFHVDSALPLTGRGVSGVVAEEAVRAAELLLRISPNPRGLPHVSRYRQRFAARYGPDRLVPLLEMLDPEVGLGPMGSAGRGAVDASLSPQRAQVLLDVACRALRERVRSVDLTADLVSRLETSVLDPATLPSSLDLYALVCARTAEDVDAGDFELVVGPNVGATAAARNLGRFMYLLEPDAYASVERVVRAEESANPEAVWAEVLYEPRKGRLANVMVRPSFREYQIVVGATPDLPDKHLIHPDELLVGVRRGRFFVHWPEVGKDVVATAGHMVNSAQAPEAARFLLEAGRDEGPQLSAFDWGPARGFPFLPRVQAGRVVLRPAQWRLSAGVLGGGSRRSAQNADLAKWLRDWDVPRHVHLSQGDVRLQLDLEDEEQQAELLAELNRPGSAAPVVLQEVLPAPEDNWTPGPGGHFVAELVVSMTLRRGGRGTVRRQEGLGRTGGVGRSSPPWRLTAADNRSEGGESPGLGRAVTPGVAAATPKVDIDRPQTASTFVAGAADPVPRLCPPGSEWLYLKLYGPRSDEEDLLVGPVLHFASQARADGLAEDWFYIRYSDPDPHLRVRFRADPERLARELLPRASQWSAELVHQGRCQRISFDTYEREIERYGGAAAIRVAEDVFCADSILTARLSNPQLSLPQPVDRIALAVLTVDDLLEALALPTEDRLDWYRSQVTDSRIAGPDYRRRNRALRPLIANPCLLGETADGRLVLELLAERRPTLRSAAERFADIELTGKLSADRNSLLRNFVHLHCNRLLGTDWSTEQLVIGLLARLHHGLARHPVG